MSDHTIIIYLFLCIEFTGYNKNFHFRSAILWDITQHILITIYRRFGTTYLSQLQEYRNSRRKDFLLEFIEFHISSTSWWKPQIKHLRVFPINNSKLNFAGHLSDIGHSVGPIKQQSQGKYFTFLIKARSLIC